MLVLRLAHARAWVAASTLLVAAMLYVSLARLPPLPVQVPTNFDKLEHGVAYLGLALWFTGIATRSRYWLVAAGLLAFGLAIELLQSAMPFGREGDPWDMLANLCGIGLGIVLATRLTGGWAMKVETWLGRPRT